MASISSVVSITISSSGRQATGPGFGIPLILTYHTVFPEKFRVYTTAADMVTDGFALTSEAYRLASAFFDQDPSVAQVIVGRMNAAPTFTQVLTVLSAAQGSHIRCKAIGSDGVVQQLDYTVGASATTTTVATAFELLVEAVPGFASAASGAAITITAETAGSGFKPKLYDFENCSIHETTADAGYDTELAAVQALNNDWFFVTTDTASPANIAKIAAWCLTNDKMYFYSTQSDLEAAGGGSTAAATLKAQSNSNVVTLFAQDEHEYQGARWNGVGAAKAPGSINWANKALRGGTARGLTASVESALTANNVNTYQPIAGLGATRPGVTASGEWIDVVHGLYALKSDIQLAVWNILANADSVPFTDAGLDLIAGAILSAMKKYEGDVNNPGLLVPGSSKVVMPAASSISATDKRARQLKGVVFQANFASAVNWVTLRGAITY